MSDEELIGIVTQHKGGRAFHSHYELKIFQIVSQILCPFRGTCPFFSFLGGRFLGGRSY